MKLNDSVKVFLPKESVWVTVLKIGQNNLFLGKVDNHTVHHEEHNIRFGDFVTFHLVDYGFAKCWEPSPHRKIALIEKVEDGPCA